MIGDGLVVKEINKNDHSLSRNRVAPEDSQSRVKAVDELRGSRLPLHNI